MKNEVDAILEDLLSRWHRWRSGYTHTNGYASTSSMFRDTKSPWSAYDRDNDAEASAEQYIMEGVDAAVERLPNERPKEGQLGQMMRLCIQFEARNLATGRVWSTPHLPSGEELVILRIQSRTRLLIELHRGGLIGG